MNRGYKTNYHSHCTYCDGKSTMEQMVLAAIDKGFTDWGFSSHAPVPFENHFAIAKENVPSYIHEFERLKTLYGESLDLHIGMEMDFITDIQENIETQAKEYGLEYIIGSVHQVKQHNESEESWFIDGHDPEVYDEGLRNLFSGDMRAGAEAYFSQQVDMMRKNKIDVIGHCDKIVMHNRERYFTNRTPWYKEMMVWLIEEIAKRGVICEINTRGLYKKRHEDYYPSSYWWKMIKEKNIRICLSSDCHRSDETDLYFSDAIELIKQTGFKTLSYFDGKWKEYPLA